jgi:hypothetical protein
MKQKERTNPKGKAKGLQSQKRKETNKAQGAAKRKQMPRHKKGHPALMSSSRKTINQPEHSSAEFKANLAAECLKLE